METLHHDDRSWWGQALRSPSNIYAVVATLVIGFGLFSGLFGGFKPQSQVDLDAQKAVGVDLGLRVAVLESRMNALPRASDYAEWVAHLSRLDAVYEGQRDKVTALSYDSKDLAAKYQSLTTTRK